MLPGQPRFVLARPPTEKGEAPPTSPDCKDKQAFSSGSEGLGGPRSWKGLTMNSLEMSCHPDLQSLPGGPPLGRGWPTLRGILSMSRSSARHAAGAGNTVPQTVGPEGLPGVRR